MRLAVAGFLQETLKEMALKRAKVKDASDVRPQRFCYYVLHNFTTDLICL